MRLAVFSLGLFLLIANNPSEVQAETETEEEQPPSDTTLVDSDSDDGIGIGNDETSLCQDNIEMCGKWAERGECEANSRFMLKNCAYSCDNCLDADADEDDDEDADDEYWYLPPEVRQYRGADLGHPQRMNFPDGTREHDILWLIGKARNYMSKVVPQKFGEGMDELCQNHDIRCAHWALQGECEANPKYMTRTCAPICGSCEMLTVESRCPLDPNEPNVWETGDLNAMFERLTSEPFRSTYDAQIRSSPNSTEGPWIITMDNVVTQDEAIRLIELGHMMRYKRSTDVGEARPDGSYTAEVSEGRTSTNAWCIDICEEDEISIRVLERLSNLIGIPVKNSENFQLLRYEAGQFYHVHHDFIEHHTNRQGGGRILTLYIYLNDEVKGGGTNFDELNITVMPKRGRVVIWPSVLDEDPNEKDERTTHQALPVESGIKYGANAWFHLRDFQTPNAIGCMG